MSVMTTLVPDHRLGATPPSTMRAAVLRSPGAGLSVETLRTPVPRAGEVLLRVVACGLCHSDLHVLGGAIPFPTPAVLGHEVAGRVVTLGPGTERAGSPAARAGRRRRLPHAVRHVRGVLPRAR